MKKFLSTLFTSTLGCFIALGIITLLLISTLAAMSLSSQETFKLKDNTIFTLKLSGELVDRAEEENPLMEMLGGLGVTQMGLDDIISSIQKAKENDKIKGIYIQINMFHGAPASLKEIRDELVDFKESGKFIISYADTYTQGSYYLSSVSDKIILNPKGMLDLHGLSAGPTFYKGLLEKLGIEMQIFKVGTFKSAVEPFMLDKMSAANRQQVESYIGDIWNTMLTDISKSRNLSIEELNKIADSMPLLQSAEKQIENKLADTLMYETEVKQYLMSLVNITEESKLRQASLKNMTTVDFLDTDKSSDIIAVLYAEGSITNGSGKDGITNKHFVKELEKLRKDKKVKAVVFRVNSGGGSAYASEQIWKAVSDLKAEKPIVISMGSYAASGGYYISCNASKIIAQPNTITGSIGIFGMFPNLEGLSKKVGLTYDNVKTNRFADFGDIMRSMRPEEKQLMQNYVEEGYDLFLTRCAEGRDIPKDSLALIAEGRVWTGNQALKLGLVDALGGIDTAIEEASKLAELENYTLKSYPRKTDFFENLLNTQKEEMTTRVMKEYLGADYKLIQTIKEIKEQDFVQARLPYDFSID